MRTLIALSLLFGLAHAASAATKFKPIRAYDHAYDGGGLYPKGFSAAVKGKTLTVTNLADKTKFKLKLDGKYKPRDARFKGYSMFRGEFKLDKWNVEDREVLLKLGAISKNRAYVRFHGDQWGGVEIYKFAK